MLPSLFCVTATTTYYFTFSNNLQAPLQFYNIFKQTAITKIPIPSSWSTRKHFPLAAMGLPSLQAATLMVWIVLDLIRSSSLSSLPLSQSTFSL
jgi:hypothetical protein